MSLLNQNLKAFLAVVKTTTVHGAAKEIGLTQTGVTQRIRVLENELSATLFIRSRRGMTLTNEGHALLRYCQAASELEGEALAVIQGAGTQSEMRIVVSGPTSIMSSRIVPQCLPVLEKFKNLLLTFQVNDLESRIEDLRNGSVQMAIVSPHQVAKEMDSKLLKPEKYVLVGSSSWKGRKIVEILKSERIVDFDPTDSTSFEYLKNYELLDISRRERLFANNNDALIKMFCEGAGFGVLTLEVAQPYLHKSELMVLNSGQVFENKVALAWYPRPQMPEYFRALICALK